LLAGHQPRRKDVTRYCLTGQPRRLATAEAMTESRIMRLDKVAIVRVLHDEPKFSEVFMSYLLARNARVEEDLVDQLFNSSEKRLARLLLLMANFGKEASQSRSSRRSARKRSPKWSALPGRA
jgi:CRP/FNR family transcriptional regulator, cyclic AMP receptor protein